MKRQTLIEQVRDAQVSVAKSALACPGMYPESGELRASRSALATAKARLIAAQKAWDALIAPAKGWAPDPLKEEK